MRGIGEMARVSGLSVSALRFHDRAGVLMPAWVDPVSGYRWYGREQLEEARLQARVRRAGKPLADGGARVQAIVPSPLADAMRALLSEDVSV